MLIVETLPHNPEFKFFAEYKPEQFTPEEEKILEPFFSNTDRPVFLASGLPEEVVGALIARHSQSENSMRRIFLDEFVKDRKMALLWRELQNSLGGREFLDLERANRLFEKHFVGFGHDSIAAPIPLVIGLERISQLGAKGIEDTRIGLSPIERSTRYGFFGEKIDGKYLYARSPVIMSSPYAELYEKSIDEALDLYAELQEPVREAYRKKFPHLKEDKIKRVTFDTTRVLLVAGNLTNLGAMINGQAAEHMIFKLKASELVEHQEIGQMLEEEITKVIPALVQRIRGDFGQRAIEYLANRQKEQRVLAEEYLTRIIEPKKIEKGPILTDWDPEGENKVIAKILWPECNLSDHQILKAVNKLSLEDKVRIIDRYLGERPDRRSKPGRAFEEAALSFQIICRFAEWRDLQRNRILTPFWRRLDYSLGVDVGRDLQEFGFGEVVEERLNQLAEAHAIISKDYPVEAQYMVAFGALMPYLITLNFRELVYIAELRTELGTHPGYARIAREMAEQGKDAYPLLGRALKFVHWR